MLGHDEFRFVIYDYGSTLAILLLLVIIGWTNGVNRSSPLYRVGHRRLDRSSGRAAKRCSPSRAFQPQRSDARRADGWCVAALHGRLASARRGPRNHEDNHEDTKTRRHDDARNTMPMDRRDFLKAAEHSGCRARMAGRGRRRTRQRYSFPAQSDARARNRSRRVRCRHSAGCHARQFGRGFDLRSPADVMRWVPSSSRPIRCCVDMARFNKVRSLDRATGIVEVESGIMWPALVDSPREAQAGQARPLGNPAEADRRRSPDDWRCAGRQRPRTRVEDEALHR